MTKFFNLFIIAYFCIISSIHTYGQSTFYSTQRPPEDIPLSERQFRVVYEWNTINIAYPNENELNTARQVNELIDRNIILSDMKAYGNRLYVTLPRMLNGVPTTLGYILKPEINGPTNPAVVPFPSKEMNEIGNCNALQFVQGIAIDKQGVMWVADSGRINTLLPGTARFTCRPKILLLDLKRNGTILHRHEFPEDVVTRGTNYLNKIVVDDAYGGFAYITDNSGVDPGIVVFSRRLNQSWKIRENNSMRAAKDAFDFSVNGTNLRFSIQIDGIALGPYYNPHADDPLLANTASKSFNQNYERNVYYAPLSSLHLYSIPASVLRDPEYARRATNKDIMEQVVDYGQKLSQTDGMIMDNRGILYYGLLGEHAIAQWDSFQPFTIENQHIIAKDEEYIQWVDGMTIDEAGYLYVVVNRLHNFVANRLNPNQINFRVLRSRIGSLSYVYTSNYDINNINSFPLDGELSGNGIQSSTSYYNSLENNSPFSSSNYSSATSIDILSSFYSILLLFITCLVLSC